MFCYKCGERLWDGRTSCQKCGADAPAAVLEDQAPPPARWPLTATLFGFLAALAAGFSAGRLVFRPFHPRPPISAPGEPDLITPMNARDPSALVMGPRGDLYCPCPGTKRK